MPDPNHRHDEAQSSTTAPHAAPPLDAPDAPDEVEADEIRADAGRSVGEYWRSISPGRRKAVGGAAVASVLGCLVAAWFGIESAAGWPVQRDLAYDVHDSGSVTVRFEVTKPKDMTAVCEVVAQEVGKAVVGRQNVVIPPADQRTTRHEVTVRTTTTAVIGLAKTCRPLDE